VEIRGTSIFASDEAKAQGTFTEFFGLRYAFIGFNGIANEHSAKKSRLSRADYDSMLGAAWHGIRSAGNTRSKAGQVPRFLLSIAYKAGHEFQFGNLLDYVKLHGEGDARNWSGPADYVLDIGKLRERLEGFGHHIERVSYCLHPDMQLSAVDRDFLATCHNLDFDGAR
ncbi:MAG: type I CRISPR-associated protein Cas7, partial [Deinococcota bacterium]|nr:type I CRISPR-associated protein Cas7 [Deinococcota bacterium]